MTRKYEHEQEITEVLWRCWCQNEINGFMYYVVIKRFGIQILVIILGYI